jgi:hypothetical protein
VSLVYDAVLLKLITNEYGELEKNK